MRCTATAYAVADARHQRVHVFGVDGRGSVIWPFNGPACGQSGQLGDALTYGLSLYVVSRNRMAKARRHVVLVNNFPSIGSAEATSV
jgi:hypothetical protein